MNKQTTAPDWSYWGNRPEVMIWEAVALSLNADPVSLEMSGGFDPDRCQNLPDGFKARLSVACANLNPPSMYERYTPPFQRIVGLEDFGVWADNLPHPWDLPPLFPPTPTSATIEGESTEPPDEEIAEKNLMEHPLGAPTVKAEAFAPRIGWQRALFDAWPKMRTTYGREPSALEAIRYLKKHDDSGCILQRGGDRELWWKPDRGAVKEVQFKTVETCISSWRTSGKLPA